MPNEPENILVVERRLIERIGMFQGLMLDTDRYLPTLLEPRNYRFVPRPAAEENEALKQLIPYFLIVHGDRIWCYVRGKKSGETRLVAKASMGIGGHINNQDLTCSGTSTRPRRCANSRRKSRSRARTLIASRRS